MDKEHRASASKDQARCRYIGLDQTPCGQPAINDELCRWHSDESCGTGNLSEELMAFVRKGQATSGLRLAHADLTGIDLVNRGRRRGFDLREGDFYRANFSGAHLFMVNLQGSSVMKASFRGANLNHAILADCNLLGTDFTRARTENVNWGNELRQEKLARKFIAEGKPDKAQEYYQQGEEIYRKLRRTCESQGLHHEAGRFFHREMILRRYQLPPRSLQRCLSRMVDLTCGYGEKPLRVIGSALLIITICAIGYFLLGIRADSGLIAVNPSIELGENLARLAECFYFSVVTFTTLGYGDLAPTGIARGIAALEAFTGSFTMALFLVTFLRRVSR